MSQLLKDLVHDLREKRLWPVAALLLLAIVVVPVVLMRSSSGDAPAAPPVASTPAEAEAAAVALAGEGEVPASSLESFDPKDPFQPSGSAAQAPAAETPPAQDPLIPDGASDPPAPASGGSPGSTGGGSLPGAPSAPGGTTPGGGGDANRKDKPTAYAYAVDVRFGRSEGTVRTYRSLDRLDVLPRGGNGPLLVFLGVSPTAKTAIFLVDSSLDQNGDGRCKPSDDECTFLHLTTEAGHDLHYFENEQGDRYAIRLLDIRRERVEPKKAKSSKSSPKARARAARERRENTELGADEFIYGE